MMMMMMNKSMRNMKGKHVASVVKENDAMAFYMRLIQRSN